MASGRGKFGLLFGVTLGVAIVAGAWLGRQNRPLDRASQESEDRGQKAEDRQKNSVFCLPSSALCNPPSPSKFVMGPFAPPIARGQKPGDREQETEDREQKTEKICPLASAFCPLSPQSWERNASASPANPNQLPLIAIVIDDLGAAPARAAAALALPAAMTMAVLPYAANAAQIAKEARLRGHEVLVHLPMQAENGQDPGPNALLAQQPPAAFIKNIQWNLARLEGYVGVNNHMGSRLTQDRAAMALLMTQLKQRGLLFLDSRTTTHTVGASTARATGVTTLERDIFLDNVITPEAIRAQLQKAEEIARRNGHAIAIGHPHPATIAALAQWAADMEARGFRLAPLSMITRSMITRITRSTIAQTDASTKRVVALPPAGN